MHKIDYIPTLKITDMTMSLKGHINKAIVHSMQAEITTSFFKSSCVHTKVSLVLMETRSDQSCNVDMITTG